MNRRGKNRKKVCWGKGEFLYPFGWSCCIDHSSSSLSAEAKKRKGETSNFTSLHSKASPLPLNQGSLHTLQSTLCSLGTYFWERKAMDVYSFRPGIFLKQMRSHRPAARKEKVPILNKNRLCLKTCGKEMNTKREKIKNKLKNQTERC